LQAPSRTATRNTWETATVLALAAAFLAGCSAARSSRPPATVALPRVVGERRAAATTRLAALGVKVVILPQFSSAPPGVVIAQGQPAGSDVASGATVALTISSGVAHSTMPAVVGMRAAAATAALRRLHLAPVSFTVFSGAPRGTVVSSFPARGAALAYDAQARLDIAGGPPPGGAATVRVPDLARSDGTRAQRELRAGWLVPDVFYVRSNDPIGSVVRQTVKPGLRVQTGTLVGLALSLGPRAVAATPVPYVVGRPSSAAVALLRSTGFHVRVVVQRSATASPRSVVDEQPMGGTKAPVHAVVTVVIAA
jgi:beta-lactam-binding protein with PASTA domain